MFFPIAILAIENDADRLFMQQIYEEHYRLMYYIARKVFRSSSDADDAVNDACLSLIKNLHNLKRLDVCKQRSYIVSTTRNACYDILRKQSMHEKHGFLADEEALGNIAYQGPSVDEQLVRDAEVDELMTGLRHLKEQDRQILEMKYFLQRTNSEIAVSLGIKADSVRQYIWNARKHLTDELTRRGQK